MSCSRITCVLLGHCETHAFGRTPWTSDRPVAEASTYTAQQRPEKNIHVPEMNFFLKPLSSLSVLFSYFFSFVLIVLAVVFDFTVPHTTSMPLAGVEPSHGQSSATVTRYTCSGIGRSGSSKSLRTSVNVKGTFKRMSIKKSDHAGNRIGKVVIVAVHYV
jgi:hypothetical protein